MKITVTINEQAFDNVAAWRIIGEILNKPKAVIGLSTGQTTHNMHVLISRIYQENPFDISQTTFFGVDEVTNVPREYKGACYTMLKDQLIDTLGVKDNYFIMPPTLSDDFTKECKLFQDQLKERGGIDLQVLGLGTNGHLGFNQPRTPFERETWLSKMDEVLEARIRKETNTPDNKELGGITLGIRNIMQARKILLVAKGKSKAEIVQKMLEGPITTDVPASILQLHPNCEFLLDQEAASLLSIEH
ncbi:glucosamine-6-phosphate deaminase [Parabacteroides sp. PF5-5]|uniref:6-phosphogluconolactonase n=1 Tax=unclassified Parabacteroides TaxID=2649774 RepID=UPI002476817C|nr:MULTISPECIES: glucosamine-6-phosphate deaminase [unclassified Parabacteroides]MDH6304911.1 glucosamine-6-phosphate deaminase [Parabacteroides sp. PH5-39]MDH6316003.1 glucosamine-6-phosphate deaminase [Parabacteroides sp. PF5-13]MDH6319660.1 glucosamine-6-phosphate deaminase [Parabacteroides sp. PH5-13]MDH6323391.1 glucosamine-6-phosphate deaminase [Parabacteroides sp. PH5-8]MDH6327100.1 glucosamine-6-phosphate deaminase [Parabacteroides sp. PH5-41]